MRQREISKYRIRQAFIDQSGKSLTSKEICETTGLTRRTVSPRLGELVSKGFLQFSLSDDGKTKVYNPRKLEEWSRKEIMISGSRRRKQCERLRRLGLDAMPISSPRGRPKKPPEHGLKKVWFRDGRRAGYKHPLTDKLWELGPGTRRVARSTGMYLQYREGDGLLKYSIPGNKRDILLKQIDPKTDETKKHIASLDRMRKKQFLRARRKKVDGILTAKERREILTRKAAEKARKVKQTQAHALKNT